jgi:hypothetical protein
MSDTISNEPTDSGEVGEQPTPGQGNNMNQPEPTLPSENATTEEKATYVKTGTALYWQSRFRPVLQRITEDLVAKHGRDADLSKWQSDKLNTAYANLRSWCQHHGTDPLG